MRVTTLRNRRWPPSFRCLEDGGNTITTHTLTVSAGDPQMNGAEDWSRIGPNNSSCPAGEAIVTATRNPS